MKRATMPAEYGPDSPVPSCFRRSDCRKQEPARIVVFHRTTMKQSRRHFLSRAAMLAAATGFSLPSRGFAAEGSAGKFKLRFAPHPGMFKAHAGEDVIDQIKFAADQGFTAWEDNGLPGRSPEMQEKIGNTLRERGMTMGVFVAYANTEAPTFARANKTAEEEVLEKIKASVDIAKRVGAKWMTVVPGAVVCQPATNWNEALPLGNGRLGAMVFGGPARNASNSTRKACGRDARRGVAAGFLKHLDEVRGWFSPAKRRSHAIRARTPDRQPHFVPLLRTARRPVARFRRGGKSPSPATAANSILRRRHRPHRPGGRATPRSPARPWSPPPMTCSPCGRHRQTRHAFVRRPASPATRTPWSPPRPDSRSTSTGRSSMSRRKDGGYDDNPGGSGPGGAHMRFRRPPAGAR
jgi:hypothetical protein